MRYIIAVLLATAGMNLMAANVQADESRSVNFMIFVKVQPNYEYDPIMFGNFSQFIDKMNGTRLLLLSHSARALSGDVINLQQDVLSDNESGGLDDVGVNCQLSFLYTGEARDTEYQLNGDCQIIGRFNGESTSLKAHIPDTDLPDAARGTDVWMEVYEDAKSGVAFYANVSKR
ncbi:hypothetical protein [Mariprofundus ferrooxydans]|uniref:Uncharacterized protein n=1 Tax=Mariprofundus ferrooxydans PV-1 TaxID=314345 RepID=Q0EW80_9PROT|nr:hypothetical protein [Mariprofundus ferrooxydans]EAU53591.1 hypothetical protein SPV1_03098 [Mariprofundus ferrooxydans PV-1]KON47978.1 hypothetical protein AL013_05760 [Mariprofundus ferrooxydans]